MATVVCQNGYDQCAVHLIEVGPTSNKKMNNGITALALAHQSCFYQCELQLIDGGQGRHRLTCHSSRARDLSQSIGACLNGYDHCALQLIEAGAKVNQTDGERASPR